MWFKKKQTSAKTPTWPGIARALDGHSALAAVAGRSSDGIVVRSAPYFSGLIEQLQQPATGAGTLRQTSDPGELAAMTVGMNLTGLRTTAVTGRLAGITDELPAMSGGRLSCVINLTCRALARQSGTLYGSHDEYHAVAGAGFFQLFAADAQEVADFNVIAHRIAELALTPGICAQDLYATSHAVQNLLLPEPELLQQFLGNAADRIDSPTPAQAMLFGQQRRRIPVLLDPDHPAGIGAVQDQESFFRALAAQRPFFYDHLPSIIDTVLTEYGELTGRDYEPVSGYQLEDAEAVVIAQGAITAELQAAVELLRKEGIRAGAIRLSMLRPFPGAQLSELLQGIRSVTVLERTDQPLAEDLPLIQEVRAVLDKALENGRAGGKQLPYPGYAAYRQVSDRPALFSGVYGVGSDLPAIDDLGAVYRNMLDGNSNRKYFYLGRVFTPPDRRFPQLQTLRQQLDQAYPDLERLSLTGSIAPNTAAAAGSSVAIHYLSGQGGIFAVGLLARAISEGLECAVRTWPRGGLEQDLQPAAVDLCINRDGVTPVNRPLVHDTVFVSSWKLADDAALLASLQTGGTLIIASNRTPESLRHDLSRRSQQLLREHTINVQVINAGKIAAETASNPSFIDQLTVWALLGIYLENRPGLAIADIENIRNQLQVLLARQFGKHDVRCQEIQQSMALAPVEVIEIPQEFWDYADQAEAPEPESPWTVDPDAAHAQDVFDTSRFWHSVGFLYDSGQSGETLADPYLATGLIPAASSAFRDISPYRLRLPDWHPENCTGCGICWAACPETALPPLVQELPAIIQGAVARCEAQGARLIQMKRIQEPLAKQAYKLLAKDDLQQYLEIDKLLRDAFDLTMQQMKLEGDKRDAMAGEFDQVRIQLAQLKLARTEPFFIEQHLKEKNTGMVLSIDLNPMTCTSCGICIEACPERAFEWTEQTPGLLEDLKQNWQLQLSLPRLPQAKVEALIAQDRADTYVNRLLDRDAYHAMLGGDGSKPGNGARTAIHLLTATAESIMQQRFARHINKLQQQVSGLEAAIQGDVTGTLNINDFADFTQRLSSLDGSDLSPEKLAGLVQDGRTLDEQKLRRQSELLVRLKQQLQLYTQGNTGKGRARMLLAVDPGVPSWWSDSYPYNPHTQPWICYTAGHLSGLAEGLLDGIRRTLTADLRLCRLADLELNGGYSSEQQEQLQGSFDWREFSAEEQAIIPPVLIVCRAGDDIRRDINRLAEDNYPVKLVVINQQGLAVPDPQAANRAGGDFVHYLETLAPAQSDTLIMQASIGRPGDLIRDISDLINHDGPALLHIYAPDPGISGIPREKIIEQAALASHGRAFPLFRMQRTGQAVNLLLDANPEPQQDWATSTTIARDHSGQESTLTCRLTPADWAVREARFQSHFKVQPKGHLHEGMLPLADYLELDSSERENYEPYIDYVNDKQQHMIATVSAAMTGACGSTLHNWRKLQALAALTDQPAAASEGQTEAVPAAEPAAPPAADLDAYQQLTARLLELCGYSQDPVFFNQTLRQFIVPNPEQPEATD